ncbi:MAG: aldehyde dehydrogenase (NADP(+)) [Pirellulaceae bacterium]
MTIHKVLIAGSWRDSDATGTFQAEDPRLKKTLPDEYPVSQWEDCDEALDAAVDAFEQLRQMPAERIAEFLEAYADRIEARSQEICELASQETALPVQPRLASGELPRTTGQLRQAAAAARSSNWCHPTIDTKANIRSCFAAIGPVAVFGPNNFPLAFGSISGGDFAAAIAAGNPVIAKGHPLHPGTTRLLAEEALEAVKQTGLPQSTVQLIYHMDYADGERLVRDSRLAAVSYTGSRTAGLKLKAAADSVGKPIYLEMSSVNPVVVLPGALEERLEEIATGLSNSCLMGTGQFCTNPGLVIVVEDEKARAFQRSLADKFAAAPVGTLLSSDGQGGLSSAIDALKQAGAETICGASAGGGAGYSYANTVLQASGEQFLANPQALQGEAFGNATLVVTASSIAQVVEMIKQLEGNLTGCVYSATDGGDDAAYDQLAPHLRQRVGRLLNDQVPTGVAVCPAMNHGGPFPATGHPGFTAVGIPASLIRFAMLQCYDNVRPHRLPPVLQDENRGDVWRLIDGQWTQADVGALASA